MLRSVRFFVAAYVGMVGSCYAAASIGAEAEAAYTANELAEVCSEVENRIMHLAYKERAEMPGKRFDEALAQRDFQTAQHVIDSDRELYESFKALLQGLRQDFFECGHNQRVRSFYRSERLGWAEGALTHLAELQQRLDAASQE